MVYGAINPFDPSAARYEIEELVGRGVNGLKLYAARFHGGKTYDQRLDDPKIGYDLIERALKLGIKTLAVHKAVPFGPVRPEPYGVADLPEVCATFPEMNFEVVHSGFAFVDETAALCGWHVPAQHYLESWSDLTAYDGTVSIVQPLLRPATNRQQWLDRIVDHGTLFPTQPWASGG